MGRYFLMQGFLLIFNELKPLRKDKNKQLFCAVLAGKQLFVIVFPWRLQIVKCHSGIWGVCINYKIFLSHRDSLVFILILVCFIINCCYQDLGFLKRICMALNLLTRYPRQPLVIVHLSKLGFQALFEKRWKKEKVSLIPAFFPSKFSWPFRKVDFVLPYNSICYIFFFIIFFLPRACKSDLKSWVIVVCLDRTIFVWFVISENCSVNRTIFAKYSMPLCYAGDLVVIVAFKPFSKNDEERKK